MESELLIYDQCPQSSDFEEDVRTTVSRLGLEADFRIVRLEHKDNTHSVNFFGSPTLLVNGRDIEDRTDRKFSLECRPYPGQARPPIWMIESALVRSLKPKHVLFICVNNSARSQLAESIARKYAPSGVKVSSAGSEPTKVRDLAREVLEEEGYDTRDLSSKGIDAIETSSVDCVVTLCAEEICPFFPGKVIRLHWGLPDPAANEGGHDARKALFVATRQELEVRLNHFFSYREP